MARKPPLSIYRRDGEPACPRCGNTAKESPLTIMEWADPAVRFHVCDHCLEHLKPGEIKAMAISAELDLYERELERELRLERRQALREGRRS